MLKLLSFYLEHYLKMNLRIRFRKHNGIDVLCIKMVQFTAKEFLAPFFMILNYLFLKKNLQFSEEKLPIGP